MRHGGTQICVPYEVRMLMWVWGRASPRGFRDRGCLTYEYRGYGIRRLRHTERAYYFGAMLRVQVRQPVPTSGLVHWYSHGVGCPDRSGCVGLRHAERAYYFIAYYLECIEGENHWL